MASRILLINSNRFDQPYPVFPLGLACVDTALRQAGHTTRLLDLQIDGQALAPILADFAPDFVGVSLRNVDDIQIETRREFFTDVASLCEQIRASGNCPVILGGSGFSIFPQRLLDLTGVDFGIWGEAEHSLVRLIAVLECGADWADIPGLVYRHNGSILQNTRSPIPAELLGAPTRSADLMAYYLRRSSMLNIQTQRGCDWNCCYCAYPLVEGHSSRRRHPESVAAELAALQQQGAKYVFIVDSVFNTSAAHVAAICEAILRNNVKLQWGCFLRPQGLTQELVHLMARAGLAHIEFGSDSFCDSVLEAYGKQFTFDDVLNANEFARREKVGCCHFLVCGGPGETRQTLQTTFANSLRLKRAVIYSLIGMRIYPGTPLHSLARRDPRYATTDWLSPVYYIAPGLTQEQIASLLEDFKRRSPHWLVGVMPPSVAEFAERLRARGILGPLWPYYELLQRLTA